MPVVILYRRGMNPDEDEEELDAAKAAGFRIVEHRALINPGETVIARYSCLPFYLELDRDVSYIGAKLVNSYRQHQFIADMREWCDVLGELTPKLYDRLQDLPEVGPFVLKGQTNSKKHLWNTHMFAADKRAAGEVWSRLQDDTLISQQEIYARDYVPLKRLAEGFNGLPITKEFRFFVLGGEVISEAFYWSSHVADLDAVPSADEVPTEFLNEVIGKIGDRANFYALDVAQTEDGRWIVVELNDGQMSGLSCNDPDVFYRGIFDSYQEQDALRQLATRRPKGTVTPLD